MTREPLDEEGDTLDAASAAWMRTLIEALEAAMEKGRRLPQEHSTPARIAVDVEHILDACGHPATLDDAQNAYALACVGATRILNAARHSLFMHGGQEALTAFSQTLVEQIEVSIYGPGGGETLN